MLTAVTLAAAAGDEAGFPWEQFFLSPGFGGAAALVAGLLAYVAARVKAADDRKIAAERQWWDALAWVYDRLTAERLDARLPPDLALELLNRLRRDAQNPLELGTIAGLLDLFDDETDEADESKDEGESRE